MSRTLLLCVILALNSARSDVAVSNEAHSQASDSPNESVYKSLVSKENEMLELFKDELSLLNKSQNLPRDKRALGFILQGFLQALGFTVSPVQLASLPNAMAQTAARPPAMPAAMPAAQQMPAMPMANATSAPPRQRETIRFTGVVNFGNNLNNSNLVSHLAQYERIFHGNATSTTAAPAARPPPPPAGPTAPGVDPRGQYPYYVQLPLPANEASDEYSRDCENNEEDSAGQEVDEEDEEDKSHYSDEENEGEQYSEPEDRGGGANGRRIEEREYKKNENVENYSLESKEINDPREVSRSKYNHAIYVGEPGWRQRQQDYVYKLAAEQEARAEALAEDNAEREKAVKAANDQATYQRSSSDHEEDESGEESYAAEEEEESDEHPRDEEEENEEEETRVRPRSRANDQAKKSPSRRREYERDSARGYQLAALPLALEQANRDEVLRDSYGLSLEQPGGKIDERIASYITMFKNPKSGVYEADSLRQRDEYEAAGSAKPAATKYEEYRIEDKDERRRSKSDDRSRKATKKPAHGKARASKSREKASSDKSLGPSAAKPLARASFYSTVKHTYQPADHGIIASLTSYDKPATMKFDEDSPVAYLKQLPAERPTTKSLLQEAEVKEIRAWPAPFDYAFDNTEVRPAVRPADKNNRNPYQAARSNTRDEQLPLLDRYKDEVRVFFNTREAGKSEGQRGAGFERQFDDSRKNSRSNKRNDE